MIAAPAAESRELSHERYHSDTTADSFSTLKLFDESPALYYHTRITRRIPPKKPTPSMVGGSACHTLLLEPEREAELICLIPPGVLASNGARSTNAYRDFAQERAGQALLKQSEYDAIRWMRDEVWASDAAAELLEQATAFEKSVFWQDELGNALKCRFDAVAELDGIFIDLKTSCEPGPGWWRQVKQQGTHRQAALYADGFRAFYGQRPQIRHIVVGNEPPYDCYVWVLPEEAIELGRQQNAQTLRRLAECRRLNYWHPAEHGKINELPVPDHFYPRD